MFRKSPVNKIFPPITLGIDTVGLRINYSLELTDTMTLAPASSAFCNNSFNIVVPGGYSARIPRNLVVKGSSCSNRSGTSAIFPDNGSVWADAGGGWSVDMTQARVGEVIPWNPEAATRGRLAVLFLGTNGEDGKVAET
jgi:hypothetical protein